MSDDGYLTPGEVRPGMRVEIVQRPWQGVITAPLAQGTFTAERDGEDSSDAFGVTQTSWSADTIGSIRLLRRAPTPGERAVRAYQDARNEGDLPTAAFQSTVSMLVVTYPDDEDLAVAVRALQAYAESRTP